MYFCIRFYKDMKNILLRNIRLIILSRKYTFYDLFFHYSVIQFIGMLLPSLNKFRQIQNKMYLFPFFYPIHLLFKYYNTIIRQFTIREWFRSLFTDICNVLHCAAHRVNCVAKEGIDNIKSDAYAIYLYVYVYLKAYTYFQYLPESVS